MKNPLKINPKIDVGKRTSKNREKSTLERPRAENVSSRGWQVCRFMAWGVPTLKERGVEGPNNETGDPTRRRA